MGKITVIGSLNMDLVVRTKRAPLAGETLAGSDLQFIPGGKGANQAVAASRAGAETHMLGCVGTDAFGPALIDSLQRAGVGVGGVQTAGGTATGTAVIVLEEGGENRIIIIPGTNALVSPGFAERQWDAVARSDLVILQHEIPLESVHWLAGKAHRAGIRVVLNPAPIYPVPAEVLAAVDVLVANETEASTLSGLAVTGRESAFEAAGLLNSRGVKTVIITLGGAGAVLAGGGQRLFQPAFPVEVVDTTAAGDTFVGGYAAQILEGKTPAEALLYAAAAAGLAVSRLGAQPSIPTRQEVEAFIRANAE